MDALRERPFRESMDYYRYHIFFCSNKRDDGSPCCQNHDADAMRDYAKKRTKELKIAGPGGVRVNKAGCMDRCSEGPIAVVYPEGVWYTYADKDDVEEIVTEHLQNGRIVERLRLASTPPNELNPKGK